MIKRRTVTTVPPSSVTNGNVEIQGGIQLQLRADIWVVTLKRSSPLSKWTFIRGDPQVVSMFMAACLSAKDSFTSTLTSEPAIQSRRHELAGIAKVSAQS